MEKLKTSQLELDKLVESINRRQILNIDKGVIRESNPDILKEFGGRVKLTDRWASSILI